MLHITGQGKPTQEVGEIVSQSEQLQPCLVILERAARELRPLDGVLAFLDPLLRRAATVVELHHILRVLGQVGDNESDAREQFARVPFDLDLACLLVGRGVRELRLTPARTGNGASRIAADRLP